MVLRISVSVKKTKDNKVYCYNKNYKFSFSTIKNKFYLYSVCECMWGGDKYIMFYKVKFSSTSDHWVGLEKKYKSLLQWASWCPSSNVAVIFLIKQTNISYIDSQSSSEQSKLACNFYYTWK